jgi:hypothetical protein
MVVTIRYSTEKTRKWGMLTMGIKIPQRLQVG